MGWFSQESDHCRISGSPQLVNKQFFTFNLNPCRGFDDNYSVPLLMVTLSYNIPGSEASNLLSVIHQ